MDITKPVLLICGCNKYAEYLYAAIKRMQHPSWIVVGILGGGKTTFFDVSSSILTVAQSDVYESLPAKLHTAYVWILKNWPETPGIFKTDEDIVFDKEFLAAAIERNKQKMYWGLTKSRCCKADVNFYIIATRFVDKTLQPTHQKAIYCYGAGYWLNHEVLPILESAEVVYAASALEDVCTGYVMNQAQIFPDQITVPCYEAPRNKELLNM
jgi:hypothetical protein